MDSVGTLYPDGWGRYLIIVFDVRHGEALARFWSERAAWRENADVEALDENHYVLIVRPGLAGERAA